MEIVLFRWISFSDLIHQLFPVGNAYREEPLYVVIKVSLV